jgi:hypothetical protein
MQASVAPFHLRQNCLEGIISDADSVEPYVPPATGGARCSTHTFPMHRIIFSLICLVISLTLTSVKADTAVHSRGPIDIYLIGGQSNATGQAYLRNLPKDFVQKGMPKVLADSSDYGGGAIRLNTVKLN